MENPIENGEVNLNGRIGNQFDASVPTKISAWTKFKNFLFQDVVVTMTPRQEEVFNNIHNFWHQEIDETEVKNFMFQKINFK